jgi:hypothetical protein
MWENCSGPSLTSAALGRPPCSRTAAELTCSTASPLLPVDVVMTDEGATTCWRQSGWPCGCNGRGGCRLRGFQPSAASGADALSTDEAMVDIPGRWRSGELREVGNSEWGYSRTSWTKLCAPAPMWRPESRVCRAQWTAVGWLWIVVWLRPEDVVVMTVCWSRDESLWCRDVALEWREE